MSVYFACFYFSRRIHEDFMSCGSPGVRGTPLGRAFSLEEQFALHLFFVYGYKCTEFFNVNVPNNFVFYCKLISFIKISNLVPDKYDKAYQNIDLLSVVFVNSMNSVSWPFHNIKIVSM